MSYFLPLTVTLRPIPSAFFIVAPPKTTINNFAAIKIAHLSPKSLIMSDYFYLSERIRRELMNSISYYDI